ncbi:MAG: DUF2834 domain-containing protein [Pseudomonadota bacterium]|nr:DUF2834 domain-containing protein [Pseudomonadota bacterium]
MLRATFLGLAIWGAIHPMAYFIAWFAEHGVSLSGLIDAWHTNNATSGLTWDLTIAAIALTVWIIATVRKTSDRTLLWAIPATFCIGVSCGLPLFLYLSTRPRA